MTLHQYVDRFSGEIKNEKPTADKYINFLYSNVREHFPSLFSKIINSKIPSDFFAMLNFDGLLNFKLKSSESFAISNNIDFSECTENKNYYNTPRKIFERQIRYWERRDMDNSNETIVSPADSRIIFGSFKENNTLFLKDKFFSYEEIIGADKHDYLSTFKDGDFAVFRLTPDKYHYNHVPVSGVVKDYYIIDGGYHSCNPYASVIEVTPISKNKRAVTIIDTNVDGGNNIGEVAMIEVAAMMIGEIYQCYSSEKYEQPLSIEKGLFLKKGQPKSLFKPGSSTVVLMFQQNMIHFEDDLVRNIKRNDVTSRFTEGFKTPLVETDILVRSTIAKKVRG